MPCVYLTRLVIEALKEFGDTVNYTKVVTKDMEGAKRYGQIARQLKRPIPIPSIIINGRLAFKRIPGKEELVDFLNSVIHDQVSKKGES